MGLRLPAALFHTRLSLSRRVTPRAALPIVGDAAPLARATETTAPTPSKRGRAAAPPPRGARQAVRVARGGVAELRGPDSDQSEARSDDLARLYAAALAALATARAAVFQPGHPRG